MRNFWWVLFFLNFLTTGSAQSFSCDGSLHLIVYNENLKESTLYTFKIQDGNWQQTRTYLSEKRKLTALVYNVSDNFLYCLDSDSYELIKISKDGTLSVIGKPRNIDTTLIFHAASISPNGRGMILFGYSPILERNVSLFNLNLSAQGGLGGSFGVTSAFPQNLGDFATDPLTGAMYGYDNKNRTLVSVGVGGSISSLNYPSMDVSDMDAIFFDRKGQLYGYSPKRGIFKINKGNGRIEFLERGPEGDYADGCSCPYTYDFNKEVIPAQIIMCDTFEVHYTFQNRLGIAQAWITLEDSFPSDFKIVDLKSSIVIPGMEEALGKNTLNLKNMIYLMGNNSIRIKVKPPDYFLGKFSSRARQYSFPKAYDEIQYSDNPVTIAPKDPTIAEIISVQDFTLKDFLTFNCSLDTAIFVSPLKNATHLWNNQFTGDFFQISQPGKVTLSSRGICEIFNGEFELKKFPPVATLQIIGKNEILVGTESEYTARWSNFEPLEFYWIVHSDTIKCSDCPTINLQFSKNDTIQLVMVDENGCELKSELPVLVGVSRKVFAPSGFTPNGDGVNDFFNLFSEMEAKADLMIFDRWGNQIFNKKQISLNQPELGWSGIGEIKGTYIWKAKIYFRDGYESFQQGEVILF